MLSITWDKQGLVSLETIMCLSGIFMFQLWHDIPVSWHNTLLETLSTTSKACMHKTCKSWYEWTNLESGFTNRHQNCFPLPHSAHLRTAYSPIGLSGEITRGCSDCPLPMKKTSAMIMVCLGCDTMKSHLYT